MSEKKIVRIEKDRYKAVRDYLVSGRRTFYERHCGSSKSILYEGKEFMYVDYEKNKGSGHHLSKMVLGDVRRWVCANGIEKINYDGFPYVEQMFNLNSIERVIGEPIVAIDINDCYWVTAYKLGYISYRTYISGRRKKEWKVGRNASIGRLCSVEVIDAYIKGSLDKSLRQCIRQPEEFIAIRNSIVSHVFKNFYRLYKEIGDVFYMFLTDCVFTEYNKFKYVKKFFNDAGYDVKAKAVEFIRLDRDLNTIHWFDFEAGFKDGKDRRSKYYTYTDSQLVESVKENMLKHGKSI